MSAIDRPQATHSPRTIGMLCLGGDWACAHGDVAALGEVARQLAGHAAPAHRRELAALVALCHRDPDRAVAAWLQLKERIQQRAAESPS